MNSLVVYQTTVILIVSAWILFFWNLESRLVIRDRSLLAVIVAIAAIGATFLTTLSLILDGIGTGPRQTVVLMLAFAHLIPILYSGGQMDKLGDQESCLKSELKMKGQSEEVPNT